MAANYVEILVKSRDDAKPDIDDLRAKLEELKHTVAEARVNVKDADAAARLDRLQAKLIDLGNRTARPGIKVTGALRAEAEIHLVEAALDRLQEKADKAGGEAGGTGLIGKILGGVGGAAGNAPLPLIGGIAAAVTALLPEIVAVASGFAAAGAGAAAFYVLAHPAINNLTGDIQALDKANQNLGYAQQRALIDPSKANVAALKKAQEQYNAIYAQMGQDAGGAAAGMLKLHDEYVKLSNAFAPDVFKVFNAGLKLANQLLPAIVPFARTFADVLTQLLGQANKFAASKGFADWLAQFHSLEGPALTAIGQGIGNVAVALGKLFTTMSGKDVAHGINIAFGVLAGAINVVRVAVEGLMRAWDLLSRNATFKKLASDFSQAWADISRTGQKKPDFSGLVKAVKDAVHTAVVFLEGQLPPLIAAALTAASKWLKTYAGPLLIPVGKALIEGLISGIESSIPRLLPVLGRVAQFIVEHKGPLDVDRQMLVPHGQAIMDGLMGGMRSRYPALRSQLGDVSGMISGGVGGPGGGYAGAGYGGGTLRLEVAGGGSAAEQAIVYLIRNYVRIRGGNVQAAFGH